MNTMKNMIQMALFLSGISFACSAAAASSTATVHKMNLKNCAESKCLELSADKAESSQFSALFALNNIVVQIHHKSNLKTKKIIGKTGYIDFDQELIVITQHNQADYLINLKDLSEKEYSK